MSKLDAGQRRHLDEKGYILFAGLISPEQSAALLDALEVLWSREGAAAGQENYQEAGARRLANLADKGDLFRTVYAHKSVLAAVRAVVGPAARLSMLNARDALPGDGGGQPLHADTDRAGRPDEQGYFAATAVWMLDDFTAANGATRLVPGSHRLGEVPKNVLDDPLAAHPDEIIVTGKRGDVLVFNGHCWHAGRPNRSDGSRRALLAHYFRAGVPRPANRRQHLSSANRARLSTAEAALLGLDEWP